MKMNSVVHFEMPAKDKKRTADFYSKVFGWKMQQLGKEMGDYLLANTTETDEKTSRPKQPGAINGGFFNYEDKPGFNVPHLVIAVENLEESMKQIKENGGELRGEAMDIPNIGKYISFKDTEGNEVGVLQPSAM